MDKFTIPSMDWSTPGDIHKRFKIFKQKCSLIFDGPLLNKTEGQKARLLLLWAGDKGLEIYNTATWEVEADQFKLKPIFERLEAYTKPQSNQILSRYQLRCLKQDDMPLEEFLTKARTLIDDSGYDPGFKDETLRDTLVFGLKSDKVRKDAISKGNSLTFQQVYDLAKTEESTRAQMQVIRQGEQNTELYSVRSKKKAVSFEGSRQTSSSKHSQQTQPKFKFKFSGCFRCGNKHDSDASCPATRAKCMYCKKTGHFQKVCMKKRLKQVHEIVQSPQYQGQEIHLHGDDGETSDSSSISSCDEDEAGDSEPITVFLNTITSDNSVDSMSSFPNKIYTAVKINNQRSIQMKVDTGADTCILTTEDLQKLGLSVEIKPCSSILKGYGGNFIENLGTTTLQVTFKDTSVSTEFTIVKASGHPSMIGCRQAQELGIITTHVEEVSSDSASPTVQQAAQHVGLSKATVIHKYQDCLDKIGRFPGDQYHIQLIDNPTPVIHPPRTVPVHILPLYKAELEKMIADDVITEVTEPTDWVNSIVCNVKTTPDGKKKVRLCLDPKDLNKNIRREHYYSRTIDEILPLLHGKKYFSVVDTTKGYWHVELDHDSSLLCTFNTPFGRYRFKRLPFGIVVSQDIFQRKLDDIYKNIPNVTGIADDIIVFGSTEEEHDQAFVNMLEATRANNVSLNSAKLQFKQQSVNFFGHTLTQDGISPAADKLEALKSISAPTNTKELLSLLGLITYLNRFSAKVAELTAPLRELTKKNIHFRWEQEHEEALNRIKEELCSAPILSYYDPDPATTTILQCDASQKGVGAWIRQIDSNGKERIVGMASRSLTDTEARYSNIERECLAVMFGLEKFEYYLLGRHTLVETDHSPLEQIFKKNIAEAPARLQRLLLRCMKFDIEVRYRRGETIPVADALSRVCTTMDVIESGNQSESCAPEYSIHFITDTSCPIDIGLVKSASAMDPTMQLLKNTIYNGWPGYRKHCRKELWDYWNIRCDLVLEDGLILKGDRVVVPESLRARVLEATHTGHQGETKCLLLARQSVFWPGISNDIRQMVKDCEICNRHQQAQPKLPAMQPDLPTRPWEKLGCDIFQFNGANYLIIVDYYSRFPVIRALSNISASTISSHFTRVFAEYGLPSQLTADFGSQFVSEMFKKKCEESGVTLTFSSPYHHQTNGVAERCVGTTKSLWKKAVENNQCPETALWMYRITPLDDHLPSPFELLYGRKPRSPLPTSDLALQSKHPGNGAHQEANLQKQTKQAEFYNRRASCDKRVLNQSEPVYIWNSRKHVWDQGKIFNRRNPDREPRTYIVEMNGKLYQRTREHLRPRGTDKEPPTLPQVTSAAAPGQELPTKQPAVAPTKVNGNPVAPIIPNEGSSSPTPTVAEKTQESPAEQRPEDEIIVVRGGSISFQPRSQVTRSGRETRVPAKFKD